MDCESQHIMKQYTDMGLCYTVNWNASFLAKDTGKQHISHCATGLFCRV